MGELSKAPATVGDAVERYLFLLENQPPKFEREYSAIKVSLKEFSKQYSKVSLSNLEVMKEIISKFLNTRYNFDLYNQRLCGINSLIYWLEDKGYITEGLTRNYCAIC